MYVDTSNNNNENNSLFPLGGWLEPVWTNFSTNTYRKINIKWIA